MKTTASSSPSASFRVSTWGALAFWCGILCGCGGTKGTLTVTLVTPVGVDPFAQAKQVRIRVGNPAFVEETIPVSGGHFMTDLHYKPMSSTTPMVGAVLVEALGADDAVVARGQSPLLSILPHDSNVAVLVAPVATVAQLAARLATPRAAMAANEVPRLGVVFSGGTVGSAPQTTTEVFQLYSLSMVAAADLPAARVGALAIGVDRSDSSTGFLLLAGDSTSNALSEFDPLTGSKGVWATVASDESLKRDTPAMAVLADGNVFIGGGSASMNSTPLATATLVRIGATLSVTPIPGSMSAARNGHTATEAHLKDGDGVVLFGGNTSGPTVETWLEGTQMFSPLPLMVDARTGHAAVRLSDGTVLIIGGTDASGPALASGYQINPNTPTGTLLPTLLAVARTGHTATLVGDVILVCGGKGKDGKALASCDVLDEKTRLPRTPVYLTTARTNHVAVVLETGPVLIAGGVGDDGKPIASLEVYTP